MPLLKATVSLKVKDNVVKLLNEKLGKDLSNLSKCPALAKVMVTRQQELEAMLSLKGDNTGSSKVADAVKRVECTQKTIETARHKVDVSLAEIERQRRHNGDYSNMLKGYFEKIGQLELALSYFLILERIQKTSDTIQFYCGVPDMSRAVEEYSGLCDLCTRLAESKCSNLSRFVNETTQYWNPILKKKLSDEFSIAMTNVQWPIIKTIGLKSSAQVIPDALSSFQQMIKLLLLVQLPNELSAKPDVSSNLIVRFPELSLPISLLVQSLRKRFVFHFMGDKPTNRRDKPEWYFTKVLTWIRDHEGFIVKWVQPVYHHLKISKSAQIEFLSGLVQMAVDKLERDLEHVQYDDTLFSHTVDEALGFDRELRDLYPYPPALPSAASVLTQAQVFVKWIQMERKFASDKMKRMLSSETAWSEVCPDSKTTEVIRTYLAILSSMTDRYSALLQPGHKLQFVDLQIELTNDLCTSFEGILHVEGQGDALDSRLPAVLNTTATLITSLQMWQATPEMLLLEHYKDQYVDKSGVRGSEEMCSDENSGIFQSVLHRLDRLKKELLTTLCNAIMYEVKAENRPYRKDRWHKMTRDDLNSECRIRPSGCPMYQALADKLHAMEKSLDSKLFTILWQSVATQLDTYLLEELVLENEFNALGGQVLRRDIHKGLLILFSEFSKRPESYFPKSVEACNLLALDCIPESVKRAARTRTNQELYLSLALSIRHLTDQQIADVLLRRADCERM